MRPQCTRRHLDPAHPRRELEATRAGDASSFLGSMNQVLPVPALCVVRGDCLRRRLLAPSPAMTCSHPSARSRQAMPPVRSAPWSWITSAVVFNRKQVRIASTVLPDVATMPNGLLPDSQHPNGGADPAAAPPSGPRYRRRGERGSAMTIALDHAPRGKACLRGHLREHERIRSGHSRPPWR